MTSRAALTEKAARPAAAPARGGAVGGAIVSAEPAPLGNLALQSLIAGGLRPKLEVGGTDDPEERAADTLASQVLGGTKAPCACGGTCAQCNSGGGGGTVRRKSDGQPGSAIAPHPASASGVFFGSGRNMDLATRGHFEARMGTDLSAVRIHDDERTAHTARSIGARAYTVGNDIGFAAGQLSPGTTAGRALLAHELAHVVMGHGRIRRQEDPNITKVPPKKEEVKEETPTETASRSEEYFGVRVADDFEFMRGELRRLVGRVGLKGADDWVDLFIRGEHTRARPLHFGATTSAYGTLRVRSPMNAQQEMGKPGYMAVAVVYPQVRSEATAFLTTFENNAITVTRDILEASEAKAQAEKLRYGLEKTTTITERRHKESDGGWVTDYNVKTSHSMENQLPGQALAGAAKDLLAKRGEVGALRSGQASLMKTRCWKGDCVEILPPANVPEHTRLGKEAEEKEREFAILKGTYEERYPVLARLSDDRASLVALSKGPSAQAAEILNDEVFSTLENIKEVRAELHPGGKTDIWKLPDIVMLAKLGSGVNDLTTLGRMRNRVVDDKVEQIKSDESIRNWIMGALAIGLALIAAIPSGGSSLVAGAAAIAGMGAFTLGAIQAAEHLDKYLIEKAMAGTDFDRAKAICASDPSLFWLAVDIVGAAADLGAVTRGAKVLLTAGRTAFTTVAGTARHFVAAKGPEAAQALADLRKAADAAESASGIPGVAGRMVASAERVAKSGGSAEKALGKAAGHEAKAIARGVEDLEKGVGKALGASPTRIGGHTVSLTPNGWLVRCTVCGTLRAEFAVELGRSPKLIERMLDLEKRAASAAAKGEKAAAQTIADEARVLADELQTLRSAATLKTLGPEASEALIKGHPQLVKELDRAKTLKGAEGEQAMADLMTRTERIGKAEQMTPAELEVLLDNKAFEVGTMSGTDLRFVRYTKRGGALPFDQWESMANRIWENTRFGTLRERELKQAFELGPKNVAKMENPASKGANFIPDHVAGNPGALQWGKPYHFEEIKDWANMSDTGNLSAMLNYVEATNGSKLTIYFKSNTYMSGPLRGRIEALVKSGKVDLIPFIGET